MLTRFFIYFICYPLAALPLCVLYVLAFPLYLILNYVVRYRRKVVELNLSRSFPEKSKRELRHLRNQYYWHLVQIAVEMIKMMMLSPRHLQRRYYCSNPELVNRFYE